MLQFILLQLTGRQFPLTFSCKELGIRFESMWFESMNAIVEAPRERVRQDRKEKEKEEKEYHHQQKQQNENVRTWDIYHESTQTVLPTERPLLTQPTLSPHTIEIHHIGPYFHRCLGNGDGSSHGVKSQLTVGQAKCQHNPAAPDTIVTNGQSLNADVAVVVLHRFQ